MGVTYINLILIIFSMSMTTWWASKSPSTILISLLCMTGFGGGLITMINDYKIQTYLLILTIVGGLFISISFVVLAYPSDYDKHKTSPQFILLSSIFVYFSLAFYLSKIEWQKGEGGETMTSFSSSMSESSPLSMIFLLLFLLIVLKLIDSMLYPESGGMFPKQ